MTSGTKKKKRLKVKVEFTQFTTYKDFLRFLLNVRYHPIAITIENSYLQNNMFNYKSSKSVLAKIARNVGQNQACSQITYDFCMELFVESCIYNVSPKDKGEKWNQNRFEMEVEERNHEVIGRANQDMRDAYKLCLMGLSNDKGIYWGIDPSFRKNGMVLCQIIKDA